MRYKKALLLSLASLACAIAASAASAEKPTPVIVTNPSVTVDVANAEPIPVTVSASAAFRPIAPTGFSAELSLPDGTFGDAIFYDVPAGKRLVIEYLSGQVSLPTGQKLGTLTVFLTVGTNRVRHDFPLTHQLTHAGAGKDFFVSSSLTRLYADPGSTIQLSVVRNLNTGAADGVVSFSGHLVDVP
jgi:hypothetical protein